jgi:RimJ/RimL family protein N-acetyltransferase
VRLETERLILRPWEDRDRPQLAAILGDADVRRFYPKVLTADETSALIDTAIARAASDGFGFFAAELKQTGQLAGWLGLGRIPEETRAALHGHPEVEIGWQFDKAVWGQGLAPEGGRAWLDYGFRVLRLPEIVAFTYEENLPSRRVMEKLGMVLDVAGGFQNPRLPAGHPLRPHVLYRIGQSASP